MALILLPAFAQTTTLTKYPGSGRLLKNDVPVNETKYTTGQACWDDAFKAYQAERLANPNILLSQYVCTGTTVGDFKTTLPTPPVVPPTTPGIGMMPNPSRLNAGTGVEQITTTSEVAGTPADGTGDFRTRCLPSHYAYDDPIVFPGQTGRSHLHIFFGNTQASAQSTDVSLRTTGNSTCRGGTVNRSSYWVPALINTVTNLPINPDESDFYYKQGYKGVEAASIQPMPQGLRMIAGDPSNKVANNYTSIYVFLCHNMTYPSNRSQNVPPYCPPGDQLEMSIAFPQCWDGVNLDSPDHKSHMAYARPASDKVGYVGCPPSHPVALPEVSFHVLYPVPANGDMSKWRLSSDAAGYPSGLSAHADWFNGWKKDVSDSWALNCDRGAKDCHSHLLGDGRMIY